MSAATQRPPLPTACSVFAADVLLARLSTAAADPNEFLVDSLCFDDVVFFDVRLALCSVFAAAVR